MKILVLTSRYTATRDIIAEDFGRQTRLFGALRELGHDIHFYCADYRKKEHRETELHGIRVMIRPFSVFSLAPFIMGLKKTLLEGDYDILVSTSDPLWGVVGNWASKKTRTPFVYDLHDNYETYLTYNFPLIPTREQQAIRDAALVTTVSHALKEKIAPLREHDIKVIQNGVDLGIFKPMDKAQCRKALGLPKEGKLICYAGSIQRAQGVDLLLASFTQLRKKDKTLSLATAGRFYGKEQEFITLSQPGIIHLGGDLSQAQVAQLINASDVAVVPNRVNAFTLYCFPYKVVEYMACNTSIVATEVGDVGRLLKKFPTSLCDPDDLKSLTSAIERQLHARKPNYRDAVLKNDWKEIAHEFHEAILPLQKPKDI